MVRISIAMAAYNGERYIKEQIDSIIPQLNTEDEIVVSCDKSTDNTYSILIDYKKKDSRIKVFKNEGRPGVFGNFENALSKCTGDVIFISDQDDIWDEKKINIVSKVLINSKYDMVIHNGVHIDCDGNKISAPFFKMYKIGDNRIRNFVMPRYSGCCTAFKRNLLCKMLPIPLKVGAYDHWIGSVGEYFGKVYYLDDILIYHRLHDENVTPKTHRNMNVIIRARLNLLLNLIKRMRA